MHGQTRRPGLVRDQGFPQQFGRLGANVIGLIGKQHTACLAAGTTVDLSLEYPALIVAWGELVIGRLRGMVDDKSRRDRDVEAGQ